jgi:hypothetical protein
VKRAVKGGLLLESRTIGKRALGHVERSFIVAGGTRQPRESVGVGETSGDKAKAVRHGRWVDNYKGARWRRETFTIFARGTLEREVSRTVAARNKAAKSRCC